MTNLQIWLRYILLGIIILTIIIGISISIIYLFKKNGKQQSNYLFGSLILLTSCTLLHQFLFLIKVYDQYPQMYFLPIYFSFSIGPLIYFFTKNTLYRGHFLNTKDLKHFILPIAQFSFFLFSFIQLEDKLHSIKNSIIFPYYGVFEKFIFVITVLLYIYFSKKYVYKKLDVEQTMVWERTNQFRLLVFLKITNYLFVLHGAILLSDPLFYKFFKIDINNYKPTLWLFYLTFSSIVIWFAIWGYAQEFLIFIEGKKIKLDTKELFLQILKKTIIGEKLYLNSNLKPSMLIKRFENISAKNIEIEIRQEKKQGFYDWLDKIRLEQMNNKSHYSKEEILYSGFRNLKSFYLQQKK